MFDIGFTELLLIAVVALIVLGPERLPKAARFAGLWVRRARAQWASVKAELEHEVAAEEIKRNLHETQAAMRQAQASLRDVDQQASEQVDTAADLMRGPPIPAASDTDQGDAMSEGVETPEVEAQDVEVQDVEAQDADASHVEAPDLQTLKNKAPDAVASPAQDDDDVRR